MQQSESESQIGQEPQIFLSVPEKSRDSRRNLVWLLLLLGILIVAVGIGVAFYYFYKNPSLFGGGSKKNDVETVSSQEENPVEIEKKRISDFISSKFRHFSVDGEIQYSDTGYQFVYIAKVKNDQGYCGLNGLEFMRPNEESQYSIFSTNEDFTQGGSGNPQDLYNYASDYLVITDQARENLIKLVNSNPSYCRGFGVYRASEKINGYDKQITRIVKDDMKKHSSRKLNNYLQLTQFTTTNNPDFLMRYHVYYLEDNNWNIVD